MKKLVLATGNMGKVREMQSILAEWNFDVLPQSEFNVPEADETGLSFIENAILKARNAAAHTGLPAIADDSGLAVDALAGAPGIYSARYSQDEVDSPTDASNNAKLLRALEAISDAQQRRAKFICAIAFVQHAEDPTPIIAVGEWHGYILPAPRGDNGFGYDPLFQVADCDISSAELSPEEKKKLSHRGQALAKLREQL